jgi:hypothetical protein
MSQVLQQARPGRGRAGTGSAIGGIDGAVPLNPRFTTAGTRPVYRGRSTGAGRSVRVITWRQGAPETPFRQCLAGWRARNWRRVVLAWFALSMIIVVMAAEPKTDFPKAQVRSVPAVQMFLRVAGGLTVAGVPVLLIALP